MRKPIVRRKDFDPLLSTFTFMKRHWITLFCLGLVAGIGRVAQLGGLFRLRWFSKPAYFFGLPTSGQDNHNTQKVQFLNQPSEV